uniref:nucleotide-binding protein n=1 Tax=Enterobacter cloacae TaxID=550 RepID=UPI0020B44087|nr:ArsA-related P-loop ATPase [Enterobacter cloacae]
MGKILLVVSDKGGVGKSTYVANTGSMLVNKGKSVIILKTDKNHDLLSWNKNGQITAYSLSGSRSLRKRQQRN